MNFVMRIPLSKFGKILVSRPAGKEAVGVILAYFKPQGDNEPIELDFTDVISVAPSWLDEVLQGLRERYGKERVICLPTDNASVIESLRVIN